MKMVPGAKKYKCKEDQILECPASYYPLCVDNKIWHHFVNIQNQEECVEKCNGYTKCIGFKYFRNEESNEWSCQLTAE